MLREGDLASTVRRDPGFKTVSSERTTRHVYQVPHAEAFVDFPQLRAGRRKETAQQPNLFGILSSGLTALGATPQSL
jgi:hypothetical protein